jgi:hypothetical protein
MSLYQELGDRKQNHPCGTDCAPLAALCHGLHQMRHNNMYCFSFLCLNFERFEIYLDLKDVQIFKKFKSDNFKLKIFLALKIFR